MRDLDNNFSFNSDDDFDDLPNESFSGIDAQPPVSPAGYNVPDRFNRRGRDSASMPGSPTAPPANADTYGSTAYSGLTGGTPNADETAAGAEAENFYTPLMPEGFERAARDRFRTRNRKPLSFAVKAGITAGVMALLFVLLSFSIYGIIIGARVNRIRPGAISTVRLSASEQERIFAEQSAEEIDAVAFTQPDTLLGSSNDIDLILVIGSDRLNGEGAPCTTNAIVLVAIDHKRDSLKLVYLSTDLYVRIPGYLSNTLSEAYYYDTANGNDDLPVTIACVQNNFGVTLDGFIVVDYLAFQTVIERLGGVTLTLSDEEAKYMSSHWKYGIFTRFSAGGTYTMSASETLNYIRIKDVGDGYLDRVGRQRLVFSNLLESAKSLSSLELSAVGFNVLPLCSTDLSSSYARGIISRAGRILDYDIFWMQAPIAGSWRFGIAETGNGTKQVLVTSYKFTAEAIQGFIYDDDMEYSGANSASGVILPDVAPAPPEEEPPEEPPAE